MKNSNLFMKSPLERQPREWRNIFEGKIENFLE